MGTDWTVILLLSAVICGGLGWAIGSNKGAAGAGLFLGALLGVIGLVIVLIMKPATPEPDPVVAQGNWWPDPHGRFAQRYYNGNEWTNHVIDADGGQTVETNA